MSIDSKELSTAIARENRRWFIGIAISVSFGLFGVVMALLSYSHASEPSGAPVVRPPVSGSAPHRPSAEPVQREHSKSDRKGSRNKSDRD